MTGIAPGRGGFRNGSTTDGTDFTNKWAWLLPLPGPSGQGNIRGLARSRRRALRGRQTPAYGWSSTRKDIGIWVVNPSIEYINESPTKIELTGHIDVKARLPANPTLLSAWQGSHYGGMPITIDAGQEWSKVAGPFLLYFNQGSSPDAMWHDALARAAIEQKEWPYEWADAPGYAKASERGEASGQLVVTDPQQPGASASGAWIGLAAPPYQGVDMERKPITITWQTDGTTWRITFDMPKVNPGKATLR